MTTANRFTPLVLCYHAVSRRWEHQLSVPEDVFEAQLRWWLRRGYRPVPADALLETRGKALHVTFDDAFACVGAVMPVLERLGVHATVFACSSFAVDGRPFDGGNLAEEARLHPDELRTLSFADLRHLAERGLMVGSHTVTHPHLTHLSDHELLRELRESREHLEDELGRPCHFVAYPFGDEDARVRSAARDAGYTGGFSLPGTWSQTDRFGLPRIGLYRNDGVVRAAVKGTTFGRHAAVWRARRTGARRG